MTCCETAAGVLARAICACRQNTDWVTSHRITLHGGIADTLSHAMMRVPIDTVLHCAFSLILGVSRSAG